MKEHYLEVIITKTSNGYKTETPNFPHCEGTGETKELALQDLAFSIRNYISEITGMSIEKMLLGNDYSTVLTDPNSKTENEHRVIPLQKNTQGTPYPVFIKLKKQTDPNKKELEISKESHEFEELIEHLKSQPHLNSTMLNELEQSPKMASEILFNVLMSLN